VNFFRVGSELYLADLPGYGYAKVPEQVRRSWDRLASSYLLGRDPLALCVFLVDARHDPSEGDEALRAWLDHHSLPYVVAATKADKLGRGATKARLAALEHGLGRQARGVMAVSAETGEGLGPLWKTVRAAAAGRRED